MRITSIQIRNYRLHRELALELDPALTLIGGPNESGKSTLVEAVHRALFLKARILGEIRQSMVSRFYGGHPEVEVAFEAAGRSWRVAKRFSGTTGTTVLSELHGASCQGQDAETRLAEILGVEDLSKSHGAGRHLEQWAHLWVWQGDSAKDPALYASPQKDSLLQRLQGQGGAAAMQSDLDAEVAAYFAAQLEACLNKNKTPKRDSDLGRALLEFESASACLAQARETLLKLQDAVREVEECEKILVSTREALAGIRGEAAAVEDKLLQAGRLQALEAAEAPAAAAAIRDHQSLAEADLKIRQLQGAIEKRRDALAPGLAQTERLLAGQAACHQADRAAETRFQAAVEHLRQARLRHELAGAQHAVLEKTLARNLLLDRLATVRSLRETLTGIDTSLAQVPAIDAARLKTLRDLEAQWHKKQAALEGMAAGIEVVAAGQRVEIGGSALLAGQSHILTEDTDLLIGADVRLRIRPGGGTSLGEARRRVQEAFKALQNELDALGIASLGQGADAWARRQQLQGERAVAQAGLNALGAAQIDEEMAAARTACATLEASLERRKTWVPDFHAPASLAEAQSFCALSADFLSEAERAEALAKSDRDQAIKALQKAAESLLLHRQALQNEKDALSEQEGRLRYLMETHGQEEARTLRLAALLQARQSAQSRLAATRLALGELQPDLLQSDRERLARALEQSGARRTQADTRLAVARSILQSDGSSDPQAALALADARTRAAAQKRDVLQRKADAQSLVHSLFLEEQRTLADQFTRPLAEKITAYLQCIFGPGTHAVVRLENNVFKGLELVRPHQANEAFAFDLLSGGAREQLAAALRLAMAEVLAQSHHGCLPLVFDDAFAHSDPERVKSLHRMLDLAARRGLQIILLSCNPADYASLGAASVTLRIEQPGGLLPALESHTPIATPGRDAEFSELGSQTPASAV